MAGFGQAPFSRYGKSRGALFFESGSPAVSPSPAWDGAAQSGFEGVLPIDPDRVTAKPMARLVTVPDQHFLEELEIGVEAYANSSGTLIGGIDRVRFHYEGRTVDVVQPVLRQFTRMDGSNYFVFGYFARLRKPPNASGTAHLFVEAIPADATMQRRVLGPFTYFPVDPFPSTGSVNDAHVTVTPSAAAIAGENYRTIGEAISYCASEGLENPLIDITESLAEDVDSTAGAPSHVVKGWMHVRPREGVAVTYRKGGYDGDVPAFLRLKVNGIHFEGNQTFDMEHIHSVYHEFGNDKGHWFDRVTFTNSAGQGAHWRKGPRPAPPVNRDVAWFTECLVKDLSNSLMSHRLVRGCVLDNNYGDLFSSARAVIGNKILRHNQTDNWSGDIEALDIVGPVDGTLRIDGGIDAPTRTLILKEGGAEVGRFLVGSSDARYQTAAAPDHDPVSAGEGYSVADVAAWMNSLPGWTASVLDDTRRASALCRAGSKGAPFADSGTGSGLRLSTSWDLHADIWQQQANIENIVFSSNVGTDIEAQFFLVGGSDPAWTARDYVFVNNAFTSNEASDQYYEYTNSTSQFGGNPHSHVVFTHNSLPNQRVLVRPDGGFEADAYCLFAANALPQLAWVGTPDTNLVIKDNVLDAGETDPAGANGTTLAGNKTTKYANYANGDFDPSGALLVHRKKAVATCGIAGKKRAALDAAGARSA